MSLGLRSNKNKEVVFVANPGEDIQGQGGGQGEQQWFQPAQDCLLKDCCLNWHEIQTHFKTESFKREFFCRDIALYPPPLHVIGPQCQGPGVGSKAGAEMDQEWNKTQVPNSKEPKLSRPRT